MQNSGTIKPRNRLILELMARGGMRIGEVLKLTPGDIEDRKLTLRAPKSGKEREIVFIPQKIADRLKEYITRKGIGPDQRIFPISYTAGREVVNKAGKVVGIHLKPHDLRRHTRRFAHGWRGGIPTVLPFAAEDSGPPRAAEPPRPNDEVKCRSSCGLTERGSRSRTRQESEQRNHSEDLNTRRDLFRK